MSRVFPRIPKTTYIVIIESKPRVKLWPVLRPITSLREAKLEGTKAKACFPQRRVLILAFDQRRVGVSKRTWEMK